MVVHGHIDVNGSRLDLPSYQVRPEDTISLRDSMRKNVHVVEWMDQTSYYPPYMKVNKDAAS
ncbi:hypothetical protein MASR2M15_29220 [Anaerolineales bacterium]